MRRRATVIGRQLAAICRNDRCIADVGTSKAPCPVTELKGTTFFAVGDGTAPVLAVDTAGELAILEFHCVLQKGDDHIHTHPLDASNAY